MTIQRIVCFAFQPGTPEAAIQQHLTDFAGLQASISQIREYRAGRTHPGDNNSPPDYDVMHYMTFDSLADIEIYRPHAAHLQFIERNKAHWERVLVLNAEVEG